MANASRNSESYFWLICNTNRLEGTWIYWQMSQVIYLLYSHGHWFKCPMRSTRVSASLSSKLMPVLEVQRNRCWNESVNYLRVCPETCCLLVMLQIILKDRDNIDQLWMPSKRDISSLYINCISVLHTFLIAVELPPWFSSVAINFFSDVDIVSLFLSLFCLLIFSSFIFFVQILALCYASIKSMKIFKVMSRKFFTLRIYWCGLNYLLIA